MLPGGLAGGFSGGRQSMADALLYGPDDPEHPDAQRGLQAELAALAAQPRVDRVKATLREQEDWEGLQLLADLQHPSADHKWLWEMSGAEGAALQRQEFADAVLLRLGADLVGERCPCARCGQELDTRCRHALRCAPGPSTQGHNRVRDVLRSAIPGPPLRCEA